MAISRSFSLSMFSRAAALDFFSEDRDLDRSLAACDERERDRWCLGRDVRLRDWERPDRSDRWDGDDDWRDLDVWACRDTSPRGGDANLLDSLDFDWLRFDLQCHL